MEELLKELIETVRRLERRLMKPAPTPEWYSIQEVAKLTQLSEDHIRRAVVGGTLPAASVGTPDRPLYRISRKDIVEWMERRKAGPVLTPRRKKSAPALPNNPYFKKPREE